MTLIMLAAVVPQSATSGEGPPPSHATVREWLDQENAFLRRYLAVVQQATHDYSYGYKTPVLLMPVAMDLFTGYVAVLHEVETQYLYPVLRQRMSAEQQQDLELVVRDQEEEYGTVKGWQQDLEQYGAGKKKITQVADTIDYLARMINRHLVLQEQRVYPFLDSLTSQEQATVLQQIDTFYHAAFGTTGQARYRQLLSEIEGEIKTIAGRIW